LVWGWVSGGFCWGCFWVGGGGGLGGVWGLGVVGGGGGGGGVLGGGGGGWGVVWGGGCLGVFFVLGGGFGGGGWVGGGGGGGGGFGGGGVFGGWGWGLLGCFCVGCGGGGGGVVVGGGVVPLSPLEDSICVFPLLSVSQVPFPTKFSDTNCYVYAPWFGPFFSRWGKAPLPTGSPPCLLLFFPHVFIFVPMIALLFLNFFSANPARFGCSPAQVSGPGGYFLR